MKVILHYLKFDWRRWWMPVVLLWLLLAVFDTVFLIVEEKIDSDLLNWKSSYTLQENLPAAGLWVLGYAAALTIVLGIADSPVRRRTWLLTRAGSRSLWLAARLAFVLLTIAVPLSAGFAFMPMAAGFDFLTILHSFWIALQFTALAAAGLWFWGRSWPHLPCLILGILILASLWIISGVVEWTLPVTWTTLPPLPAVLIVCLTLPAFVCLRAAGRDRRRFALCGWLAGFLLPLSWLAAAVLSRAARVAFPGPIERALLTSEENRTFTVVSAGWDHYALSGSLPFRTYETEGAATEGPAVQNMHVLSVSRRRQGETGWSPWRPASGSISRYQRPNAEGRIQSGVELQGLKFDMEGIATSGVYDFRLQTRAFLMKRMVREETAPAGSRFSGHGWTYEVAPSAFEEGYVVQRARIMPGLGIEAVSASRPRTYEMIWNAWGITYRPGHYYAREWLRVTLLRSEPASVDYASLATAPVTLALYEQEECLCELKINGINVTLPGQRAASPSAPAALAPPPPSVEPFTDYRPSFIWPPDTNISEPVAESDLRTASRYLQWLKGREYQPGADPHATVAEKWWRESLEIAAQAPLREKNALLKALGAGFPPEHRTELFTRLSSSPWLISVVVDRSWQQDAKPYLLEVMNRGARMPAAWQPLVWSYRDPAFDLWIKQQFELDVPTILYWESLPELAAALPEAIKYYLQGWPYHSRPQSEALLTSGSVAWLDRVLQGLNARGFHQLVAAAILYESVRDAEGHPPPPHGLTLNQEGRPQYTSTTRVSAEFLRWFSGLTASDFTFDRAQRRFIRKPSTPRTP